MSRSDSQEPVEAKMSLGAHLDELRRRIVYALVGLVVATGAAIAFGKQLIALVMYPYVSVLESMDIKAAPVALTVTDAFITYFRVSLLAGIVAASPWICYQLWLFVAAGLYQREKGYVRWAVPFSAALFVGGAAFFLTVVSYPMLRFFMNFNQWLGVRPVIRLNELIKFMTNLMLVFGLAFQTPIVVFMLAKMGLVTTKTLAKYRRHVIVGSLILAASVTSPSPVDQIALALPMWLLYELGIVLAILFGSEKEQPQD